MVGFICLFFPAAVSVWIFEALAKSEFSIKETIFRFCTNTLIINLLCMLVKKFIFGTAAQPLYTNGDMVPNVAIVYIVMALAAGVLVALAEVLFSKKVKVTVEEEPDEAEEKEEN